MRGFDAKWWRRGATATMLGLSPLVGAQDAPDLAAAISGGTPSLDLRLRYEGVEQDNPLDDADALTLRSRLGYGTATWHGLSATLEFEGTVDLSGDAYNSTLNGETGTSVVADPEGEEVNQAYLQYAGPAQTVAKLGRQRLVLDNARFIGNVGWRQNEQTFDGVTLVNTSLPDATLTYGYLTRANRIFFNDFDMDGHVLNAAFQPWSGVQLSAFAYLIDYEAGSPTPPADSQTLGASASYTLPGPLAATFTVSYAEQSDYADAPSSVDADYLLGSVAANLGPVTATLAYEVLGGDGEYAFQTPLATLHAFQGWADLFLGTPPDGIQDSYLQLAGNLGKFKLVGVYHDFQSDHASIDYGSEIDLLVARPLTANLSAALKFADYSADEFGVDTTKLWAMLEYKF